MSTGLTPSSISAATHSRLAEAALEFQPSVRLVRLPLMAMDGDCMDPVGMAGGPDEEPPSKKPRTKIIPYKLKESDKKMVYDSGKLKGTVIYTEEFKRSVWDFLLEHSLAEGELRYPDISHSVLYKWRRKAHEQAGLFMPQRKSLMADLKKDRDKDDTETSQGGADKDRRYSEPPKVPKLKISLKLATKDDSKDPKESKEPRVKQITALSDDLTVEKKIRVVIFALQNSTQKAAEHFNMRAGDVHSFMSQNVIRRMAIDRIRKKMTKGGRSGESGGKSREEIEEIINLARRTSVERAARQYSVREGQVIQWVRAGVPPLAIEGVPAANSEANGNTNGRTAGNGDANDGEDEDSEYLDFMLKVIDMARKQTLSRASQTFQVPPNQVIGWMRQFFTEEEIRRVQNSDDDQSGSEHKADRKVEIRDIHRSPPLDADELEKMLYHRLQQPSSRIRVIDTGEMAIEKVVAVLKVALTEGSKTASAQFNIPRTTVSTWITRNNLEELVGAAQQTNTVTNVATTSSSPTSLATAVMAPPSSRTRRSGGAAFESHTFRFPSNGNSLHSVSRSPFKNAVRHGSPSGSPLAYGIPATMGDQLESMEDDQPMPSQCSSINGNNNSMDNQTDSNNNDASFSTSKDSSLTFVNGNGHIKENQIAKIGTANDVEVKELNNKTMTLSLAQIETARELGITMRCLSRWLECRDHFLKLRNGRTSILSGDALRELLNFRLEATDYAQKEGRLYAASIFRVTLSELHEWSGRREAYVRALSGRTCSDPQALAVVDGSDWFLREREELARAQAIAHRAYIHVYNFLLRCAYSVCHCEKRRGGRR
ncbi:uncharacterized protein LOC111261528 isoform X1 [Varroa jacobsoni]|uniref:Uncharacterized protein n=1 Tax=Varroa destructor TaxID=109461 RepID=A0A7M7MHG1_VARDE|nr:uncharacterized protein LOC111250941 isoform X1 [Varroa destructor]XP_022690822.1 uncharacterized protein LOC111261528 isoform X1 [Varroa jacobsoni]XP_022690823.1 uncharacterized protein LOC111261528 isoform X1 [Varroa jacobsoni]